MPHHTCLDCTCPNYTAPQYNAPHHTAPHMPALHFTICRMHRSCLCARLGAVAHGAMRRRTGRALALWRDKYKPAGPREVERHLVGLSLVSLVSLVSIVIFISLVSLVSLVSPVFLSRLTLSRLSLSLCPLSTCVQVHMHRACILKRKHLRGSLQLLLNTLAVFEGYMCPHTHFSL